jgi:cobalamin biosynthesis protein CobD/CbiB
MSLTTLGRWGGIATIILLVITLLRQLVALVSFLMIAIKAALLIAFLGLIVLIALSMLKDKRRRSPEEF